MLAELRPESGPAESDERLMSREEEELLRMLPSLAPVSPSRPLEWRWVSLGAETHGPAWLAVSWVRPRSPGMWALLLLLSASWLPGSLTRALETDRGPALAGRALSST